MFVKLSLIVSCVVLLIVLGVWRMDIISDRANSVNITKTVNAYNDWKCGYAQARESGCETVFEVMAGSEYQVQRIRYGKDFMAIKVRHYDTDGWLFHGADVQLIAGTRG